MSEDAGWVADVEEQALAEADEALETVMSPPEPEILGLVEVPAWCDARHVAAAWALSLGVTDAAAGKAAGVARQSVWRWKTDPERGPEFERLVKELSPHTGYAKRVNVLHTVKWLMQESLRKGLDFALRKHDWVDLARLALELSGDRAVAAANPVMIYVQNQFIDATRVEIAESAGEVVDVEAIDVTEDAEPNGVDNSGEG